MSLTSHQAMEVVTHIDGLFRLRPEEQGNPQRRAALAQEVFTAFKETECSLLDVQSYVLQWRRPMSDDESERIRVQTRPSGWDLRGLHDRSHHQQQASAPARGCPDCADAGHRIVTAALWSRGLLRVQALVISCDCGQGNATLDGKFASEKMAWWRGQVRDGLATFQGDPVVLVVDAPPVFGDVVLEALVGTGQGEILDADTVADIEMRVLREMEG